MKKFILFLLLILPLTVFAGYNQDSIELNKLFENIKGMVISTDNNQIIVDIGKSKNAQKGIILDVYKLGEEIIHPITGEKLGRKTKFMGKVKIDDVQDKYSIVKFLNKPFDIKVGDMVKVTTPVKISFQFEDIDKRQELLLKDAFSKHFSITENADYIFKVSQDNEGGINLKVVDALTNQQILYRYFSSVKIANSNSASIAKDMVMSHIFKNKYRTMTVGDFIGDGNIYIAAATKKKIDIFLFDGKSFEKKFELKNGLNEIISVDSADLNKNGRDELFISVFKDSKYMNSDIYEFNNKKFKVIKSNERFVFRSVNVNGEKKIICQRLNKLGQFIGNISYYEYEAGTYRKTLDIDNTNGFSVFGFGYSDINGNGKNNILYIDKNNVLNVYEDGELLYQSDKFYNKTPNFFAIKELENEMERVINRESLENQVYKPEEYINYLTPRVITTDKGLILVENIKSEISLGGEKYKNSKVDYLDGSAFTLKMQMDLQPVIVDMFMIEGKGSYHIFALTNLLSNFFFGDKSRLIFFDINK